MLTKLASRSRDSLFTLLVLGVSCAVTAFRQPSLLTQPRFWGEEGTIYYSGATCLPWFQFLQQPVARGYYRLYHNLIALFASSVVRLELAPLVTTIAAFCVQMLPLIIVLTGRSILYRSRLAKSALVCIILLNLYTGEIWLHTGQDYWLLSAALILLEDTKGAAAARAWFYSAILLIAGLTAPAAAILAPLFLLKVRAQPERGIKALALVSGFTLVFQLVFFAATLDSTNVNERLAGGGWATLPLALWSRIVVAPIAGVRAGEALASISRELAGLGPALGVGVAAILLALFGLGYWWLAQPGLALKRERIPAVERHRAPVAPRVLAAAASLLILGFTLAFSGTHGDKSVLVAPLWSPRYFFVPSVLFFVLLLSHVGRNTAPRSEGDGTATPPHSNAVLSGAGGSRWSATAAVCAGLLALSLVTGAANFPKTVPFGSDWPNWRHEVSLYRNDASYDELAIWPPGWTVRICSP
jgi:hypothetical protein